MLALKLRDPGLQGRYHDRIFLLLGHARWCRRLRPAPTRCQSDLSLHVIDHGVTKAHSLELNSSSRRCIGLGSTAGTAIPPAFFQGRGTLHELPLRDLALDGCLQIP